MNEKMSGQDWKDFKIRLLDSLFNQLDTTSDDIYALDLLSMKADLVRELKL